MVNIVELGWETKSKDDNKNILLILSPRKNSLAL